MSHFHCPNDYTRNLKILFIGERDHAQCAQRLARAINAHALTVEGVDSAQPVARVCVLRPHPFGYAEDITGDANQSPAEFYRAKVRQVVRDHLFSGRNQWVITTGDSTRVTYDLVEMLLKEYDADGTPPGMVEAGCYESPTPGDPYEALRLCRRINLGVLHVGSLYRKQWDRLDRRDYHLSARVRFISPDSLGDNYARCGDPTDYHERDYIYPHTGLADLLHVDGQRRRFKREPYPVIVHSPSSTDTKGTHAIREALHDLGARFDFHYREITKMAYRDCVAAREGGHIYLDQFNPAVGGFGYAAVEAAAQGMAPIATTNKIDPQAYRDNGLPVPPVLSCEGGLKEVVAGLLADPDALLRARISAYNWVYDGGASLSVAARYVIRSLMETAGDPDNGRRVPRILIGPDGKVHRSIA